jgi:hypothetical protein
MVIGQFRGSRSGFAVVAAFALGAMQACGSRSPLADLGQGFAGEQETGGSGGSTGGAFGGGTGGSGGRGDGGVGGPGMGAAPGAGGTYPGAGGTYPGAGGDYTGGAYPTAGYGGVGGGVGGAFPAGGIGGKGMGTGGKGMGNGGKGGGADARAYKGCVLACSRYSAQCPALVGNCLSECDFVKFAPPNCSSTLADYFFCLSDNMIAGAMCTQDTCSGPGCMSEAQELCAPALQTYLDCISPPLECYATGEFFELGCVIQTYCADRQFTTKCSKLGEREFECTCTEPDSVQSYVLGDIDSNEACYATERVCGFPQVLRPPLQ